MRLQAFNIAVPDHDIQDLHRRLSQTRWPATIDEVGWTQGMDAAFLKTVATYWRERFDWRAAEARLNQTPQFRAVTDAEAIHFVHLKGVGPNALPIVLTHGWPSTFAEFLQLGEMLSNPEKFGAPATDSFDVVIPSLPGYGFSSAPAHLGTNIFAIADHWVALMRALGYERFIAHGGDLGAGVSTALGLRHASRILGLHLNFIPGSYQPHLSGAAELTDTERTFLAQRTAWLEHEGGYSHVQSTKPDVLGPALNDSPTGLAAWILDKFRSWSDCNGDVLRRFTINELLTTISLYWFTRSMPSAIRLYWENRLQPLRLTAGERVDIPVAVAHFPRELPIPPQSYVQRGYNVVRWTEMGAGGHFAALEEPQALADDIRSFARQLRSKTD